jgi:N-acylneuraminate cytidylyltransferase
MKRVAFIPVRGGSKSIPLKNIKVLAGKPLLHWSLAAAADCPLVDEIVVATDSEQIAQCARDFGSSKVQIYFRDSANAQDTSSTESVMLEYLLKTQLSSDVLLILIQATNPFIRAEDLGGALHLLEEGRYQSLLSVVRTKRFFWKPSGVPLNYDFTKRPRRQDFEGLFMENGAFYINSVDGILKSGNRLSGKIGLYVMPEVSGFEIDEPTDWVICEGLLGQLF